MSDNNFATKLEQIIKDNLSNEKFGVGELSEEIGMSRSTLLRKLKSEQGLSAGQLIRQVRLQEAKKLLQDTEQNISEIAYAVGFSGASYFIKCFRDAYGVSPGDFQKKPEAIPATAAQKSPAITAHHQHTTPAKKHTLRNILLLLIMILVASWFIFLKQASPTDKSIAVLPFENNSPDQSNLYIVNGVADAVLDHLQKIHDLKVISRTSVEKYRKNERTIKEISEELDTRYLVEGSGQKIGNRILLNIRLVDGHNDRQIWSEAYERDLEDIFALQRDIASSIVTQVKARITPEEKKQLEKLLTSNLEAYDDFMQGQEHLLAGTQEGLENCFPYFEDAIEKDPQFARAYSSLAIAYYYLDIFKSEKTHHEKVHIHAEKAYLLDPTLSQALLAKAFSYINQRDYSTAVTYLEKALEIHPNSAFILNYLSNFYNTYIPNTAKYLEYSLKGMELDRAANDSSEISFSYLHLGNALMQNGFLKEALHHINKSLEYNNNNIYSHYVKAYIKFALSQDLQSVHTDLLNVLQMDTSRLDVIQEVAKSYFNLQDYPNAWKYYNRLLQSREDQNMSLFIHENIKIAWVCKQLGDKKKEEELLAEYLNFVNTDQSIYQPMLLSAYYAYTNQPDSALEQLNLFAQNNDYHYWVNYIPDQPYYRDLRENKEFIQIMKKLKNKFWSRHEEIRKQLKNEGVI